MESQPFRIRRHAQVESIQFTNPDATHLQVAGGSGDTTIDVSASTDVVDIQGGTGHTTVVTRLGDPVFFNEGDTFTLDLSNVDTTHQQLLVSWGDGTSQAVYARSDAGTWMPVTHTYLEQSQPGVPFVAKFLDRVKRFWQRLQSRSETWRPRVASIPNQTFFEGGTFSAIAAFSDPGEMDSWTATVDYGDGSGEAVGSTPTDVRFESRLRRQRYVHRNGLRPG